VGNRGTAWTDAGALLRKTTSAKFESPCTAPVATEAKTFCGLCAGMCALRITRDENGRVTDIRGDHDDPLTAGYACIKGLQLPAAHASPERLLHPLKRTPGGQFVRIGLEEALDEIGERLHRVLEAGGPEAIGAFRGTLSYSNYMLPAWLRALGSHGFYSTMTVDQSAKWVAVERLGAWAAGREPFATADVMLLVGANPLVSLSTFNFQNQHPVQALRAAKARGMKLIVIDPRRTETARYADLHLQPIPGQDPALLAGLLHVVLRRGWYDAAFCAEHVQGLDELRNAVQSFDPHDVAVRCGVSADALVQAAELFARCEPGLRRRGSAASGVGPNMAPHSNLAEHLLECLNVVCGRYPRPGDSVPNPGVISARRRWRAQAISPQRSCERGYHSPTGNYGTLFGEKMSGNLADEALAAGPARLRALIVDSGNPARALPDQRKTVRALKALELLVVIDPFLTDTARLAHYVLPPLMTLERPALPPRDYETIVLQVPYSHFAPAVLAPPTGAELVDPNYVFWALARRLGTTITFDGVVLDRDRPPTTEDLLALLARHGQVPFDEIRRHPGGRIYPVEPQLVEPADPQTAGHFEVMPRDVAEELRRVRAQSGDLPSPFTHRLIGRRMRDVQNTTYQHLPLIRRRHPYNPAYLHPDDLARLATHAGVRARIVSATGSLTAILEPDEAVRPGVISMSHGWGGLPDAQGEESGYGACTNLLTTTESGRDPINAMPIMSAIPVRIELEPPVETLSSPLNTCGN
jgi:anaerobic selenocysteine-containing dehydrogenase